MAQAERMVLLEAVETAGTVAAAAGTGVMPVAAQAVMVVTVETAATALL
jgi:hypothetical protein